MLCCINFDFINLNTFLEMESRRLNEGTGVSKLFSLILGQVNFTFSVWMSFMVVPSGFIYYSNQSVICYISLTVPYLAAHWKMYQPDSAVLFSVVSENCRRAGHTRLEATSGVPQSKGVAKRNHQIYASSIVAYAVHTSIKYKTSKADGTTWRRRTLTSCLHLRPRKCARCRPLATASHNSFLPFSARIPKVADMIKWDKSYRLLST